MTARSGSAEFPHCAYIEALAEYPREARPGTHRARDTRRCSCSRAGPTLGAGGDPVQHDRASPRAEVRRCGSGGTRSEVPRRRSSTASSEPRTCPRRSARFELSRSRACWQRTPKLLQYDAQWRLAADVHNTIVELRISRRCGAAARLDVDARLQSAHAGSAGRGEQCVRRTSRAAQLARNERYRPGEPFCRTRRSRWTGATFRSRASCSTARSPTRGGWAARSWYRRG